MKKETFFGLAMLSLAGCSTTSQQTAALDVQPLELESLKPEKIQPVKRVFAGNPARNRLIADGKKLIGTRYRYGGTSEKSGFDCSGLVQHVFAQQGYRLPRSSKEQFSKLLPVKEPRPGDLIFFRHGKGTGKNATRAPAPSYKSASPYRAKRAIKNRRKAVFLWLMKALLRLPCRPIGER